jgi:hypothetical protein
VTELVALFADYGGAWAVLVILLLWRLWKVQDRFTAFAISALRESTQAQRDTTATLTKLADKIERLGWPSAP